MFDTNISAVLSAGDRLAETAPFLLKSMQGEQLLNGPLDVVTIVFWGEAPLRYIYILFAGVIFFLFFFLFLHLSFYLVAYAWFAVLELL